MADKRPPADARFLEEVEIEPDNIGGYGNEGTTIRELIMNQYKKCINEGSKELNCGVQKRFIDGKLEEIRVTDDDTQIFINSVDMLRNLLEPTIKKPINNNHESVKMITAFDKLLKDLIIEKTTSLTKLDAAYQKLGDQRKPTGRSGKEEKYDSYQKQRSNIITKTQQKKLYLYKHTLLKALNFLMDKQNYFGEA